MVGCTLPTQLKPAQWTSHTTLCCCDFLNTGIDGRGLAAASRVVTVRLWLGGRLLERLCCLLWIFSCLLCNKLCNVLRGCRDLGRLSVLLGQLGLKLLDLLLGRIGCLLSLLKLALGALKCFGSFGGLLVFCAELCKVLLGGIELGGEFRISGLSGFVFGVELLETLFDVVLLLR